LIKNTRDIGVTLPATLAKSAESATESYLHSHNLEYVCDLDNLYNGYLSARKHKRNKKAIFEFEKDLGRNLEKLSVELKNQAYKPSKYRTFTIKEPKERLIVAPTFRDSIVQHTIYNYVYDLFDRSFVHDSYGCRKSKGTHKASQRLQDFMRECNGDEYYLQLDIRKYYYRINHTILRDAISRKIDDERLTDLIMLFVNTADGIGLYVGNILSQLFGLIYLNRMDNFIKRVLKVKRYIRYVDDFILIGFSKEEIYELKRKIEVYIKEHLELEFSKFRIAKISKGSNFVGFRTWKSRKFVRKRSLHNFSKALKKGKASSLHSMLGHAEHSSSIGYMQSKIKEHENALQIQKENNQRC